MTDAADGSHRSRHDPLVAPVPPIAKQVPHERTHHGDTVVDPFEWLRDKDDPETIAHLKAENAYTQAQTTALADLREEIFTEIRTRTLETDLSVPSRVGDWWYYARTVEGQQYPLHCRTAAEPGDWTPPQLAPGADVPGEQLLLDGNELARGTRVLLPRLLLGQHRRQPARVLDGLRRKRALHAADPGPTHRRAAARRGREHDGQRNLGPQGEHPVLHDGRRRLAPPPGLAARARYRCRRGRGGLRGGRRAVLGRGRPHSLRPLPDDRQWLEDHDRVPGAERRRPDG